MERTKHLSDPHWDKCDAKQQERAHRVRANFNGSVHPAHEGIHHWIHKTDPEQPSAVRKLLNRTLDATSKSVLAQDESMYLYQDRYDGVAYLKLILTKVAADSRATAAAIRAELSRLDSHIVNESKEDIVSFNSYVKEQIRGLKSLGGEYSDLLESLFDAYLSVSH